jgi:hypothetical protein
MLFLRIIPNILGEDKDVLDLLRKSVLWGETEVDLLSVGLRSEFTLSVAEWAQGRLRGE